MLRRRGLRRPPSPPAVSEPEPDQPEALTRPERTEAPPTPRHNCLAPSVHLYLTPDGNVRVCCRSFQPLGNVTETPLLEIWRGAAHRDLISRIAHDDYSAGCEQCHRETLIEGRSRAYPANFDSFTDAVETFGDEAGLRWPSRIEFNLSNICNLMCIQCTGLLSSSIRAHREHLPPLPDAYGERFFEDLEQFIPHLTEAQFAGGEPFLAKQNFRVWDLITELNPELPVIVVTNATQWNRRIDEVTSRLRMGYTFSIDGLSKQTYEEVRINARHEVTMGNIDRYIAKAHACDMPLEVNFCVMPQNYQEFPDIMLWAEEREIKVNASIVRNPVHTSLPARSTEELAAVVALWESRDDSVRPHLGSHNLPVWDAELARVRAWLEADDDARQGLYWETEVPLPTRNELGVLPAVRTSAEDWEAARSWVAGLGPDAEVHTIEFVDVQDDYDKTTGAVVAEVSAGLASTLGIDPDVLVGAPSSDLLGHLQQRFGALEAFDLGDGDGDGGRQDAEITLEGARVRSAALPSPRGGRTVVLVALSMR